jgi:peptidoglycan/xylan/chitin deacetylase (PgdA/CDA1 family)
MTEIALPTWPDGTEVAVTLSFDVDAEAGWLGEGEAYAGRLTSLSEGRFGVTRGLPRILRLLHDEQIPATFYVPGDTARRHARALSGLRSEGHEVGHHGFLHLRSDAINEQEQRRELVQGIEALQECLGVEAKGYRSPAWELTPETMGMLVEMGFAFDSSCMGDDRPYYEEHGGSRIIEFPVHWSLDDWPYFAWHSGSGELLATPSEFVEVWLAEFESAVQEHRHITFTMHPEVIGRGYRMAALRTLIAGMRERARVWFATHSDVADLLRQLNEHA